MRKGLKIIVGVITVLIIISSIMFLQLSSAETEVESASTVEYDPGITDAILQAIRQEQDEYHVFEQREIEYNTDEKEDEEMDVVEKEVDDPVQKESKQTDKTNNKKETDDKPSNSDLIEEKEKNDEIKEKQQKDKKEDDEEKIVEKEESNNTHVFLVPHPDDEVLSMGAGIIDLVEKGKDVHLILLTVGEGSSAINRVNERLSEEGLDNIGVEEFVDSRIAEFREASRIMGVPSNNQYIYRLPDGGTNVGDIEGIVKKYQEKLNPVQFHAISETDNHIDHKNAARSLKNLYADDVINTPMFYLSHRHYNSGRYDEVVTLTGNGEIKFKNACYAYKKWSPEEGRYGVGWMSVRESFENVLEYKMNKIYLYN